MTGQQLIEELQKLTDEQLSRTVTAYDDEWDFRIENVTVAGGFPQIFIVNREE